MSNAENAPESIIDVSSPEATARLMEAAQVVGKKSTAVEDHYADYDENTPIEAQVPCILGTFPTMSPTEPFPVACHMNSLHPANLKWWDGDWYVHRGTHYQAIGPKVVDRWLWNTLNKAVWKKPVPVKDGEPTEFKDTPWKPNPASVAAVQQAWAHGVVQHIGEPIQCQALTNYVLDPATRETSEHTPTRFNLAACDYAYDPEATAPTWLAFLEQILPGDTEAQALLQQWFGYVLSGRTEQHKILNIVGPRRSGKGTIVEVMTALLGQASVATSRINNLIRDFGTMGFLGKRLVAFPDERWNVAGVSEAVPMLLQMGATDTMETRVKNKAPVYAKSTARVMFCSNDAPSFTDASGALVGRLLLIQLKRSFYGQEDLGLVGKLTAELPGILNWALDGLDALGDGKMHNPTSALSLLKDIQEDSNKAGKWFEECAVTEKGAMTRQQDLYDSWCIWGERQGEPKAVINSQANFTKKLKGLDLEGVEFPGQVRHDGVKATYVRGVKLIKLEDEAVAAKQAQYSFPEDTD